MLLYFAYGSNMSPKQMARRCPGAQAVGRGMLHGWKYITTKKGTANIRPSESDTVHGVLWRCSGSHIATLDEFEGVRLKHYLREFRTITVSSGKTRTAVVYISSRGHAGVARPEYLLSAVIPGAQAFNLPSDYIDNLRSWLPRYPIGVGKRYVGRRVKPVPNDPARK